MVQSKSIARVPLAAFIAAALVGFSPAAFAQQAAKPAAPAPQPAPMGAPGATPTATPVAKPIDPAERAKLDAAAQEAMKNKEMGQPGANKDCPLKFEEPNFEWGSIPDSAAVTHLFKFKNTSDRTVTVKNLQGSCGCTVPQLEKRVYSPGEGGEINVTFNPQGRRGAQAKTVTVFLEDAACPQMELHFNVSVKPQVYTDPPKVYFQDVMKGTGGAQSFMIIGRKEGFDVTSIEGAGGNLTAKKVKTEQTTEDGDKVTRLTIEVTLDKDAPVGVHQTMFTFKTNDDKAPETKYYASATVVGDLRATPNALVVRTVTPRSPFEAELMVDSRTGKPFKIDSLGVDGPSDMNLVVDKETSGPAGYKVKLSGVTPSVAGPYRGTIKIKPDIAGEAALEVTFYVTVQTEDQAKQMQQPPPQATAPANEKH